MKDVNVNFNVNMNMDTNSLIAIIAGIAGIFGGYVISISNGIYPSIERDDNLKKTKIMMTNVNQTALQNAAS